MFFCNSLTFLTIQQMLAIWSLVPLPFSKSSLNIWKFLVHILLKPGLENFQHYFASMWDECNCAVVCAKNVQSILWLSLGLEWKLAFPRPVATALLSKFSGILTSEASGIWLQNFHRTWETDSRRAQTNPCAHQEPGERSSVPRRGWVSNRRIIVILDWPKVWKHKWTFWPTQYLP